MSQAVRGGGSLAIMILLFLWIGFAQSWSVSLAILHLCLISAIMALGLNLQWGFAGLFNAGVMGFAALGGLAAVLVSASPVSAAWQAGGVGILASLAVLILVVGIAVFVSRMLPAGGMSKLAVIAIALPGYAFIRYFYDPATEAIEAVESAKTGYLGGLGLPIIFSWVVGGVFAAGAAWLVGRIALGLRSDYFAIATLGISEIIIAILKNEDWLARGVKNVTGLDRPVPYEVGLQSSPWFTDLIERVHAASLVGLNGNERAEMLTQLIVEGSSVFVKLCYAGLFALVLIILLVFAQRALNSPWGRMMRAIRDNEVAANAMGKDVTSRHRQVFIVGAAITGVAGAMLTTLDGQFTPTSYQPLRFTFLIWVMVIVGGSGNNYGAVLGGFLVWFIWIEAEPFGLWLAANLTSPLTEDSAIKAHFMESAPHLRLFFMGLILLIVLRFSPRGLLPER